MTEDLNRCPACGGEVDTVRTGGKTGISLNAYFYRPRGVLIGYLLCGRCADIIHRSAARMPGRQIVLHKSAHVEGNLETPSFAVEEGAVFNGQLRMGGSGKGNAPLKAVKGGASQSNDQSSPEKKSDSKS